MKAPRATFLWRFFVIGSIGLLSFLFVTFRTGSAMMVLPGLRPSSDPGAAGQLRYSGSFVATSADGSAPAAPQANILVLDTVTSAPSLTTSGSTPRSYMGDPFNAANPGGALEITQVVFYMASTANQTYSNGLCLRIRFWDSYNSAASPVFSNAVGTVRTLTVPGPVSLAANGYYVITGTFSTPLTFADLANNGFVLNYQGDDGSGCADMDTLTSIIRYVDEPDEAPIAVGGIPLSPPDLGYYRNASGRTDFNFDATDLRTLSATNSNAIAIKLYARAPRQSLVYLPMVVGPVLPDRKTYNAHNADPEAQPSLLPGTLDCSDNPRDPTCSDAAIQAAHDNVGTSFSYYLARFGRDSFDDRGMTMVSSAHVGQSYSNAFWSSTLLQLAFGDGDGVKYRPFSQGLDVVGHEVTHAVTNHTADLDYRDESGALNEAYSDIMGNFIEAYANGGTLDWLHGEGIHLRGGADRSLVDPHQGNDFFTSLPGCVYRPAQPFYCGQPATMSEFAGLPYDSNFDNGGVHINGGIISKAAYLMAQGGAFGGVNVTGIGAAKTQQLFYRALTRYLGSSSNFAAARRGMSTACTDLVGQFGISAGDCTQVNAAFAAVGVGTASPTPGPAQQISGRVTLNGAPASGVVIYLQSCGSQCSDFLWTVTDSSGNYSFPGTSVPSTANWFYRVVYRNPGQSLNGRLRAWISDRLDSYVQGDTYVFKTFDIGDVQLGSPNSSATSRYPATFTWTPRPIAGDYYLWQGYTATGQLVTMENPYLVHSTPRFTVSGPSDPQLYPGTGNNLSQVAYWNVGVVARGGTGLVMGANRVSLSALNSGQVLPPANWQQNLESALAQPSLYREPEALDKGVVAIYRRSGGIFNIQESLVVYADGTAEVSGRGVAAPRRLQTSSTDISQLRTLLGEANLTNLLPEYRADGADLMAYVITVQTDQGVRTIVTMDSAATPVQLEQLKEKLDQMMKPTR